MKNPKKLATAALVAFAFTTAAQAQNAPITWGAATDVSGPTDVAINGTYVDSAVMSGVSGGPNGDGSVPNPDVTVNGLTFNAYSGNFTTVDPVNHVYGLSFNNGSNITADVMVAPANTSTGYQSLYGNNGFNYFTTSDYQLTLGGLTAGDTYQVQLWAQSWDQAWPVVFGDDLGDNVTLNMQTPTTTAQFAIGTFTADGSTESISYLTDESGYAFTPGAVLLENVSVPEPTTFAIVLGGAGMLMVFRRRRA